MKKLWFVRRRFGWGWTPATWQGWAVLGVYTGGIISLTVRVNESMSNQEALWQFFIPTLALTILLLIITLLTGEKPRWQWGKKNEKQ